MLGNTLFIVGILRMALASVRCQFEGGLCFGLLFFLLRAFELFEFFHPPSTRKSRIGPVLRNYSDPLLPLPFGHFQFSVY